MQGVFSRVFTDFGEKFVVIDKDGEELQELVIESISTDSEAVVKLQQGFKHKFEDGDEITLKEVKGMTLIADTSKSINDTIHKVKVINP